MSVRATAGDQPDAPAFAGTPRGWLRWSGDGFRFVYPPTWQVTRYIGPDATVVFPFVFLSEHHLGGPCPAPASTNRGALPPTGSSPPGPKTNFPTPPGIGRPLAATPRLRGTPRNSIQPRRAAATASAASPTSPQRPRPAGTPATDDFLRIEACIGPNAPASEQPSVHSMLASLTFVRTH